MTLAKQNTKNNGLKRKIQGSHHRQSHKYLKTYWPYLPILLIIGGSILTVVYAPGSFGGSSAAYNARVESLIGSNSTVLLDLMYAALALLAGWYLVHHFKRLRSLVTEGESYLAKHYVMDIFLGVVIGSLVVLVS